MPEGFAASLETDAPDNVVVMTSGDNAVSAEVARAVTAGLTDRANAARLGADRPGERRSPGGRNHPRHGLPAAEPRGPGRHRAAGADRETGAGGDVSPAAYFGPAMGLLFLFLSVGAVARELLTEKRTGLLDRVRAAAAPTVGGTVMASWAATRRAIATIVRNDLRRTVRDRVALFFIVVLPVVIILAAGSASGDGDDVGVGVVDRDHTTARAT